MSFSPIPPVVDLTAEPTFETQDQIVLILCGLVASGKSTFAEALQQHYPQFRRCNQDDLGDRRRVEQLAYESLEEGLSVCIDRTNFNASQRAHWIAIAREFPGTQIWTIVFDTPYETCAVRLQTRTNHPTIHNAEQGLSILARFAADFQHPAAREGFDRMLYLKPEDHASPVYTRADIATILQRVRDAPLVVQHAHHSQYQPGNSFRGNANRGRGRGWGQGHYQNQYQRGRGTGRGGSFNYPASSAQLRGWHFQSPPYRGTNVGIHGTGRGILHSSPMGAENPPNPAALPSQGKGTGVDPFIID